MLIYRYQNNSCISIPTITSCNCQFCAEIKVGIVPRKEIEMASLTHMKINSEKYDKKRSVKEHQKKYKIKFDMDSDRVDLRTMSENYFNGLIPLQDIHECLNVLNGSITNNIAGYDPEKNTDQLSPKFAYLQWNELYLMPKFQRDVVNRHIQKILTQFDPSCVVVPCAVKLKLNGSIAYVIWDGHHTLQVMKYKNYLKFPVWYIDITTVPSSVIQNAGFTDDLNGYLDYAIWRAGTNMRFINSKLKLPLHNFDDFMIGCDIKDSKCVSMMSIFNKYKVTPVRKPTGKPYELSQIKSATECYDLHDSNGNQGIFLDRSLNFHTKTWIAPIELEVFRPMAYLYQRAVIEGKNLDATFDSQMGKLLQDTYGDPKSVQEVIKSSYYTSLSNGTGSGQILSHDKERVTDGLINLYNQKYPNNNLMPSSKYKWKLT